MPLKRKVEIFTAGCAICRDTISKIESAACCDGCETVIVDTQKTIGAERAKTLGISSLPAVAIDGKLLSCSTADSVDLDELKEACT